MDKIYSTQKDTRYILETQTSLYMMEINDLNKSQIDLSV